MWFLLLWLVVTILWQFVVAFCHDNLSHLLWIMSGSSWCIRKSFHPLHRHQDNKCLNIYTDGQLGGYSASTSPGWSKILGVNKWGGEGSKNCVGDGKKFYGGQWSHIPLTRIRFPTNTRYQTRWRIAKVKFLTPWYLFWRSFHFIVAKYYRCESVIRHRHKTRGI